MRRIFYLLSVIIIFLFASVLPDSLPAAAQPTCSITGLVYRDFDADGARGLTEPGQPDVRVSAFNAAGVRVGTTLSLPDGTYVIAGLNEGQNYRIEFTEIPTYLESGPYGGQSTTTVTFADCDSANPAPIELGVNNPGQFCNPNPDVATSCYVVGSQFDRTDETVVSFPYSAGAVNPGTIPAFDQPPHANLALANQVGTTWGLAYQRETGVLFAGAFIKRHTGLGPSGPGAIYAIEPGLQVSTFALLNAGVDPHPAVAGTPNDSAEWMRDTDSWAAVGKVGLGDMDVSDDGRTLWVVNLFDQSLYEIGLNVSGGTVTAGSQIARDLSGLPNNCPASDVRPFATAFHNGRVYVGMVCSAQSSNNPQNMWAYVYSLQPGTNNFREEIRFRLDYPRGCANFAANFPACLGITPSDWNPWIDNFAVIGPPPNPSYQTVVYPQAMLTDIEFTSDNTMVMGFRDRYNDQAANLTEQPFDLADNRLYFSISAGDVLLACRDGVNAAWELENNAACQNAGPTAGQNNDQGPGGGEYYFDDALELYSEEVFIGGLAFLPGTTDLVGTYFDPIPNRGIASGANVQLYDAGVRWLNNETGAYERAYRVFNGNQGPTVGRPFFGKSNGLGDLEVMCAVQPIEIGNRVWFNRTRDGIQNPGPDEFPVPGVTVNLYYANDPNTIIATTVTDGAGEYYFTDINVQDRMLPLTEYIVRLDNPADYDPGGPLDGWLLTLTNAGQGANADLRDNDASMQNTNGAGLFPTILLTTGTWGQNNHTYDFGFYDPLLVTETPTPTVTVAGTPGIAIDRSSDSPEISKIGEPPFAQISDTVTWTITITNPTDTAYPDVLVTDTIPAGMTIVSVSATAGSVSYSGQTVTFTMSSLAPGQTVTITIVTTINDGSNVPLIFDNVAVWDGRSATARVVRASLQPATGITPPLELGLLAAGTLVAGVAIVLALRRRRAVME